MAELTKEEEESNKVKEDWKFVAMVLDRSTCLHTHGLVVFFHYRNQYQFFFRLFLWIFSIAVVVGTAGIILQVKSPAIETYSNVELANDFFCIPNTTHIHNTWRNFFTITCLTLKMELFNFFFNVQAPSLYDLRPAIDELLSEIQQEKAPIRV